VHSLTLSFLIALTGKDLSKKPFDALSYQYITARKKNNRGQENLFFVEESKKETPESRIFIK